MNSSSSLTAAQKGVIKMGPKEYNEIKQKMGKLLSIQDQDLNESNLESQQSREHSIAKQRDDIYNQDYLRSITPSSNTLSMDSLNSKNKIQLNSQILFSPSSEAKITQSVQSLSKNGSPKCFQITNISKPKTEQTSRRRNYSQAITTVIKEEEESQTQIRQVPKTTENKKDKVVEGSLLTRKNEVQYINHLRKGQSKLSFHDHMNYLELDSHIHELCDQQNLFTNRNVISSIVDKESDVIVPKKYDDYHVTEGIVPNAFDEIKDKQKNQLSQQILQKINQNHQIKEQNSTNEQKTHNPKLKNKSFSTLSYLAKTNQISISHNISHQNLPQFSQRSSAQSVQLSPKDQLAAAFTQTMTAMLQNNQINNQNLLTSSQSQGKSTYRPLTQQGLNKTGLKFNEIIQQPNVKNQQTKNSMQQLLQVSKSKSSVDLKSVSRQSSQDTNNKIDLAAQKPKPIYAEQKQKIQKRQEVLNVKKWMEEKLDELVKTDNLSINQVFTYFQNVFQASISEILRQVASECKERSQLLQEIWDTQISMSEKIFISISKENNKIEKNSLDEINKLHKSYQTELQKQFQMVDDRNKLIQDLKQQLQKSVTESRVNRKKGQKVEKNYKIINNQINQLQEEYNILFQENLALLMNQNKIDWQTALKQKKKMLEEINLNRKMRNDLIKVGENFKKEKLTLDEQMKKHEIDEIVRQFVIDRESNMPVSIKKIEEEVEEQERQDEQQNEFDENKQVVLKEFWKNQSTDTNDLLEFKNAETNTVVFQYFDGQTQTKKIKQKENGQQINILSELADQDMQTENECFNVFCQTMQVELSEVMVQCDLIQDDFQNKSKNRIKQEIRKSSINIKNKKNANQFPQQQEIQNPQNTSQISSEQQSDGQDQDLSIIYTDSANETKSDEILQTKKKQQKSSFLVNRKPQKQAQHYQESSGDDSKSQISQSLNSSRFIKTNQSKLKPKSKQKSRSKDQEKENDKLSENYFITGLDEIENQDQSMEIHNKAKSIFSPKQNKQNSRKQSKQKVQSQPIQKQKEFSQKVKKDKQKNETSEESLNLSLINDDQLKQIKDLFEDKENIIKEENIQKIQEFVDQTVIKSQKISTQLQEEIQKIKKYEQIINQKEEEIKQSKKYQIQLIAKLEKQQKETKITEKREKKQAASKFGKRPSIHLDVDDLDSSQNSERQGGEASSGKISLFKEQHQNKKQTKSQKRSISQNKNFSSYLSSASEQDRIIENIGRKSNSYTSQMAQADSQKATQNNATDRKKSQQTSTFNISSQKKEMNVSINGSSQTISNSLIQQDSNNNNNNNNNNNVKSSEEIFEVYKYDRAIHTEQLINDTVEEQSQMIQRNFKVQKLNLNFSKKESRRSSFNSEVSSTPKSNLVYSGHYSLFSGHQPQKSPYSTLSQKHKLLNVQDVSSPSSGRRKALQSSSLIQSYGGQLDSPRSSYYSNSPSQNSRSQNKQYSINTEAAILQKNKILSSIQNIKAPKNALKYLPQIIKMINSIVQDNFKCLKSHQQILNPLYVQMYEYFLYLFGLRKVAELKMISVLEQCVLMKNEYPYVDIFMQMYFNDISSVDLHFFCKTFLLLLENNQQVKVEKSSTNKYKIITTIPQVIKIEQYQKQILDQIKKFEQIRQTQNRNEKDQENEKKIEDLDFLQINNLSTEVINDLNSSKFDVFEVIQFFMNSFKELKQRLQEEYLGVFYAISANFEKAFIDDEGVELLSAVIELEEQQKLAFIKKYKSKSIMNEMSFEQFILLAYEQNLFKTQQILDKYPHLVKPLLEIKEFWLQDKQKYEEKIQVSQFYNIFTKNLMEKLDILTQLMEQEQTDINDNSYLKRHEQSFQICYIILNKVYQM